MVPPIFSTRSRKISFLDNYYEHGCAIISEDVLWTDIVGSGAAAWVSRWWYDLFLVSYRSQHARLFFLGSFALRNERLRQFRSYRCSIHPWSPFRIFWRKLVVCCVMVTTYTFTLTTSTLYEQDTRNLYPVSLFCELVLLLDLLLQFRIGYVQETSRSVVLRHSQIVVHYISTKLFLHAVTAIPLQMILTMAELRGAVDICTSGMFVCALRLLNTIRLLRILEMTSSWTLVRGDSHAYSRLLSTIFLVVLVMNQVLCLSDTLTLIEAEDNGSLHPETFLAYMLVQKFVIDIKPLQLYCLDMARLFKSFIISSQGFYLNRQPLDRIIALVNYFLGTFFLLWALLELAVHFHCKNYTAKQKALTVDGAKCFINARQLSDSLRDRIAEYYRFADVTKVLPPKMNEMYTSLPESIQNEVKIACRGNLLNGIQQFSDLPTRVIHAMILALKIDVYLSGDVVAHAGSPVECMSIVESGILAEYPPDDGGGGEVVHIRHFIDGDRFGEECLAEDSGEETRSSELVALTNCSVVSLYRDDFRTIIMDYQLSERMRNDR